MPRIAVAALVPYQPDTAPSQRFRIEQWAPFLADLGIDVRLVPFADAELTALLPRPGQVMRKTRLMLAACARSLRAAAGLPRDHVVLVHRAAWLWGPPFVERHLRRRGHRLVFDFDDAIFRLNSSASNRALAWLKMPGKTGALCRMSDHVAAGNGYLAEWARRHNSFVTIIPTSIDTDRCRPALHRDPSSLLTIGWTGSATSQQYLEIFAPVLRHLLASGPYQLHVLSTRRPELPGVPHRWTHWTPEAEVDEVARFDVGIMPLADDPWAVGKCALKALQYMAAAVPTVASPVGANREVITHGENGMLAGTEHEWIACMQALARNADLRMRLGEAGRRTVLERYSMRTSSRKLAEVLEAVRSSGAAA